MSRHIVDHRGKPEGGRTKNYVKVDREKAPEGSHPATKTVHERAQTREGSKRMREYTRIERGEEV